MKHLSLLLVALSFALGSTVVSAQSHGHAPAAPVTSDDTTKAFDALDTNKDGQLSKDELAKHPMGAHASMVDANQDDTLSREEFKALQQM